MSRQIHHHLPAEGRSPAGVPRRAGVVASTARASRRPPLGLAREPLDAYLSELGRAQPLSREEEVSIAQRLEQAESDGFDALVASGVTLDEIVALADELAAEAPALRERLVGVAASAEEREQAKRIAILARLERRHADFCRRLRPGCTKERKQRAELRERRRRNRNRRDQLLKDTALPRTLVQAALERVARQIEQLIEADRMLAEAGPRAPITHQIQEARRTLRVLPIELGSSASNLRRAHHRLGKIRRRAETARTELATANLRLVVAFARRYAGRGVPLSDLIQEGNLGLMRAVDRFDHRAGTKFATYASWWLRQSMQRAVANQGRTVRLPVHVAAARATAARAHHQLLGRLGRPPGQDEVAIELGVGLDQVRATLEAGKLEISLETPLGEDGRLRLGDVVADPRAAAPDDLAVADDDRDRARGLLEALPARERRILCLRFGIGANRPHTLQEIGDQMGLTRERIRQLEVGALGKLRRLVAATSGH